MGTQTAFPAALERAAFRAEPGAAAKRRSKELCAEAGLPGCDGPAGAAPARLSRLHAAATKARHARAATR